MASYSYNSDTFESSTKDTSYVTDTLKTSPRKSAESPRKSYAQSYGSDTFESTMIDSYATDTFETGSSGEETLRHLHYSLDTFENVTITDSVPVSYSMDSFESTIDDSTTRVGYSTDTFESSDTGETVARVSYSPTDTYNSYDSETITTETTESFESVVLSPRKSESVDFEKQQRLEAETSAGQKQFIDRLVQHLQSKPDTQLTRTHPKKKTLSDTDRNIRRYCKKKIQSLKLKNEEKKDAAGHIVHQPEKFPVNSMKKRDQVIDDYGIPSTFLDRLKITNILESMEQACKTKIHEPKKCKICRKKMAEIAAANFVKERKATALNKLVELKMEQHLYQRDSITLIGEIMKDMPDLRQPPNEIWQKLHERCSKTDTVTTNPATLLPSSNTLQINTTIHKNHKPLNIHRTVLSSDPVVDYPVVDIHTDPKEVWTKLLAKYNEKQHDING